MIRRDPNYRPPRGHRTRRHRRATAATATAATAAAAGHHRRGRHATTAAGRGRRPPPKPKKPRRKRRWGRVLLALLLVVVVAVVAGGLWMDSSLHRIPALADYPERPAAGKGTTWLLVGSDSRQHLTPEQQAELATGGDIGDRPHRHHPAGAHPRPRFEHADHDGVHPARLLRGDSRLRQRQDQRGVRRGRRPAAGADRRAGHRVFGSTTTPRSVSTGSP